VEQAHAIEINTERSYAESIVNYFRGWRYPFFGTIFIYVLMVLGWVGLGGGLEDLSAPALRHVSLGVLAATLLLFGIFLINDAADRDVDARVHPDRPIPQGKSSWKHIMATAVVLMLLACFVSSFVNRQSFLVAVAMTTYAFFFYGWAKGGLDVAGSSEVLTPVVSAMFPLYGLSVAACVEPRVLLGAVLYIYLADFSQDLLGGIHDQVGDREGNVKTFALAIGPSRTIVLSICGFVLATLAGASLLATGRLGFVYATALFSVSMAMIFFYARLIRLAKNARSGDATLLAAADRTNHLAGMFFFIVSASTFLDHVVIHK
jgi:4-hydroxybenzoate polyprenyltransferase